MSVPLGPIEANMDSFFRTSVCPLGHMTLTSASPMARRTSNEVSQSRHRYS